MSSLTASLLARAQSGDSDALEQLVQRYLPRMKRWVSGRLPAYCRRVCDTDDLVQDTLVRVMRGLPAFQPTHEAALQAYLRVAVWNRLREEIRRAHIEPATESISESHPATGTPPLEAVIGREAIDRYEAGLQLLDEDERSAIIGRLEFGYSYPELSLLLGRRTPDAARKLVERALPRLAELMREHR